MRLRVQATLLMGCVVIGELMATPALAQNWSFDARTIGMGGVGATSNLAMDMVDEQRPYRPIVLPFGLLQVLPNLSKLDPTKDEFDLIRAIEYSASPIHFIVGRDDTSTASAFVTDLRKGTLNRDLNTYRGFSPATSVTAEGLASPSWGHTFKIRDGGDGPFQGIFVGAGPYFSMATAATIDPALANLFASETPVYVPNSSFRMANDTEGQFALAITGGYRGRFALGTIGSGSADDPVGNRAADGLYVGINYHYLHGFDYEHFLPAARLDTNAQGLLTIDPAKGFPIAILRNSSRSGTGFAIDTGVAVVAGPWEAGLGVNGIANRIDWTDAEQTNYILENVFTGGDFQEQPTVPLPDVRVELPVDVRGNLSYNAAAWSGIVEYGHGFNGTSFRGGFEQRLGAVQLRAGGRYVKERWEPTGGVGFTLSDHFGIDVGLFGTSANLERKRHLAIAASLRLIH